MRRVGFSMLFGLALVGSGCGIHLDPKVPRDLAPRREGSVGAASAARGMPERAGWGTFTVFAIPVAPVHVSNGPGERIIMDKVKETLVQAGYQVVEPGGAGDGAVLEGDVKRFRFRNYTWLFPIVFTWGGADLDMRLAGRDGRSGSTATPGGTLISSTPSRMPRTGRCNRYWRSSGATLSVKTSSVPAVSSRRRPRRPPNEVGRWL